MFQFHLWAGLLVGLYTVLMGVTGSALIVRDAVDSLQKPRVVRGENPHVETLPLQHGRSLDEVLARIVHDNPGFTAMGFGDLQSDEKLPVLYLTSEAKAGQIAQERAVSFDPQSGEAIRTREVYGGFLGTCAYLHIYLGAGTRGSTLNGVLGVLFLGICISGWIVRWPGIRGIRRALRIHWRARLARLNWDLHTAGGFWINPVLAMAVLTGVMIIFPAPFQTVLAWMSGARMQSVERLLEPQPSRETSGALTTPEQAFLTVRQHEPKGFGIGYLGLPTDPAGSYDAYCYRVGAVEYTRPMHIYVDRRGGTLLGVHPATRLPWLVQLESYVYALHFGTFAGWPSQALWFLAGLAPVGLLFSGVWMYLRRQRWFRERARRAQPANAKARDVLA